MPADSGVEDVGAGGFGPLRELGDLLAGHAAIDEVDRRDAVDEQEVLAGPVAGRRQDLGRQLATALEAPAELVVPQVVGRFCGELVDQVSLGPHDLHAVVAGLPGQLGGARERGDGVPDIAGRQHAGHDGVDASPVGARPDRQRVLGVPARMQDLQGDEAAGLVDRAGDDAVRCQVGGVVEDLGVFLEPAFGVRGVAVGQDQRGFAAGPGRVELGDALGRPVEGFQPGMHGPHDDAVAQGHRADRQRLEQARVTGHASPTEGVSGLAGSRSHRLLSSRSRNFWILPVAVLGSALTRCTYSGQKCLDMFSPAR